MANVNLNDDLHEQLMEAFKAKDQIEYPTFKNYIEKMLLHSLSCEEFAGKHKNKNTR